MKKAIISMFTIWLYAVIATGVLVSCRNKALGDAQPKNSSGGFPQRTSSNRTTSDNSDFVTAAKAVTPGVVHIKTTYGNSQRPGSFFEGIYGRDGSRMTGSGSGVVISADGYIATNNHV
ncbi:MAG TPA: hypothetical protein VL095_07905, partial [Flavisolibacter sp.]|nr:hypothetical protein [Flavisolibacter sp.]